MAILSILFTIYGAMDSPSTSAAAYGQRMAVLAAPPSTTAHVDHPSTSPGYQ